MLFVLVMSTFMPMSSELDFVEGLSGDHRVTKAFRQQGYLAAHFDIRRGPEMDVLSPTGLTASLFLMCEIEPVKTLRA